MGIVSKNIDNNASIIILVSGFIASGKTTFCKKICTKYNYEYVNTGMIIYNFLKNQGVETQRKEKWGETFLSQFDGELLYDLFTEKILPGKIYVMDGIRLYQTYLSFKRKFPFIIGVFMDTSWPICQSRYMERENTQDQPLIKDPYHDELIKIRTTSMIKVKPEYYQQTIVIDSLSPLNIQTLLNSEH